MLDVLFVFEANVIQQLRIGRNDLLNLDGPRNFSVILPFLLALSGNAVAAGAQGQLEMGASYYVANNKSRNAAMPFAKQGFIRFKGGAKSPSEMKMSPFLATITSLGA